MRLLSPTLVLGSVLAVTVVAGGQQTASKSVRLEDLTWVDAEARLGPDTVVVIPLGAAAKEHGPHLKLRNDAILAEHLTRRVTDAAAVVVAPAISYHYYPAFLEYPGSTSLSLATALDGLASINRAHRGGAEFTETHGERSTIMKLHRRSRRAQRGTPACWAGARPSLRALRVSVFALLRDLRYLRPLASASASRFT